MTDAMQSNRNGFAAREVPLTIKDAPDIGAHSGNFLNCATPSTSAPSLEITASRQFTCWLAEQNLSLAFTTYQAGKVFLLGNGDIVHSLRIEGVVEELYDVQVLPGVRRPMAIGFKTDEIRRAVTMG